LTILIRVISMSKVQKNMISRRSIYRFSKDEIDLEILEAAFEAARHAPNHKQTYPWKFYVLGEETRQKIIPTVELLAKEKAVIKNEGENEIGVKKAISKILESPLLIAVTTSLSPKNIFREEEDYAATVCSLHNLVLSLWEQGIGSQWSTGKITRHDITYEALNISKRKERIIGFIKAGYPLVIPERKKKALSEIRFYLP
tara:strand:+ start:10454 stop:11053 length:600 start_codon:yes stop_codon:yes gene_type:complete